MKDNREVYVSNILTRSKACRSATYFHNSAETKIYALFQDQKIDPSHRSVPAKTSAPHTLQ